MKRVYSTKEKVVVAVAFMMILWSVSLSFEKRTLECSKLRNVCTYTANVLGIDTDYSSYKLDNIKNAEYKRLKPIDNPTSREKPNLLLISNDGDYIYTFCDEKIFDSDKKELSYTEAANYINSYLEDKNITNQKAVLVSPPKKGIGIFSLFFFIIFLIAALNGKVKIG